MEDASRTSFSVIKLIQRRIGDAGKALLAASIACSMFSVIVADEWKGEVANQVGWWSDAIVGGEMGSGAGAVLGPVGAILGGIGGNILGGLGFSSLSIWFYGATTSRAATDILLENSLLEPIRDHVKNRLNSSGKNFYVHRILATHLDMVRSDGASASVASQIANTEVTAQAKNDNVCGIAISFTSDSSVVPGLRHHCLDQVWTGYPPGQRSQPEGSGYFASVGCLEASRVVKSAVKKSEYVSESFHLSKPDSPQRAISFSYKLEKSSPNCCPHF